MNQTNQTPKESLLEFNIEELEDRVEFCFCNGTCIDEHGHPVSCFSDIFK